VNRIRNFNHMYAQGWYCVQLLRIGRGQAPDPAMGPLRGMMGYLANEWRGVRALRGR